MKVLIISHNPMSVKHSSGKTLLAFFSKFKKEELCQLYIHTGTPDREACESYYRVTDKSVLKGVITRRVKGGEVKPVPISVQTVETHNAFYKSTYGSKKKRQPHIEILRDIMWKISPWYNKSLKQWIEGQKPTCIYVAIGSSKFLYDMALKISKDYNLPIYTYVCDDFYFADTPKGVFGAWWKKSLDKKTRQLFCSTKKIVSICDEMSTLYSKEFSRPALTIMTGTNYEICAPQFKEEIKTISYFGKISLNRYKSIADICRALDEINAERETDYSVEIFCEEPDDEVKAEFADIKSARFNRFLMGENFDKRFFESDALLHIEAFDAKSIDRVKHSVSTKIADSLSSGIPLFAYGPDCVASIGHLIRNNCAIVATNKAELKEKLITLFCDANERKASSERNVEVAKKFHDPESVSGEIYSLLSEQKEVL